jgi:hypothetical protein
VQPPAAGFGSYLAGILPNDIATSAGAFAAAMLQIRNISNVPTQKFAQVVSNLETTRDLAIGGTNVPVDTAGVETALSLVANGSGPRGSYTLSDCFGCMSGLPYNWKQIQTSINQLESDALYAIYKQMYLAVTWERPVATVNVSTYSTPAGLDYNFYYKVTSITVTNPGGGYSREGGLAPTMTISGSSGATASVVIGTDDENVSSFGKVASAFITNAGTPVLYGTGPTDPGAPVLTATFTAPPGPGWPGMNIVIQDYIIRANQEIQRIAGVKDTTLINKIWSTIGTQLSSEQRARALALGQLTSSPKSDQLSTYPLTTIGFVDTIPQYAMKTEPHMQAQTLEAISDLTTLGGQSIVGMMREQRNQARLSAIGIDLDNNIPDSLTDKENKELIGNGTLDGSSPAILAQLINDEFIQPDPYGYYDAATDEYYMPSSRQPEIEEPGSLSSNPGQDLIPAPLDAVYTSGVTIPSTYTVGQAIDDVIRCNCDCWDML